MNNQNTKKNFIITYIILSILGVLFILGGVIKPNILLIIFGLGLLASIFPIYKSSKSKRFVKEDLKGKMQLYNYIKENGNIINIADFANYYGQPIFYSTKLIEEFAAEMNAEAYLDENGKKFYKFNFDS